MYQLVQMKPKRLGDFCNILIFQSEFEAENQ